ncbi:MAG TPA: universal stress protein [Natronosporangium sp.]|nr:universal stress protein [Natronosporangium sp.]
MDADRTGRVIVGISTTLSGLHALRVAVAHARERRVPLHAVRTWEPPADPDVLSGSGPGERPLASAASATVASAFTETLGAVPADIEVRTVVVPDSPGPVLVGYACRDTDLLVIGTGRRSGLRRLRGSRVVRYCVSRAVCPVLVVPPPPLTRTGSPRSLMRELRRDIDDLDQLTEPPSDPPPLGGG